MRLTRQSEIAIGILAIFAEYPEQIATTRYLANETGTTKDHAAQIAARLVRNRFLNSSCGRRGGLQLAADPRTIRIAHILRLTQPELVGEEDRPPTNGGPVQSGLQTIVDASAIFFMRMAERFTIADLLNGPQEGRIACLDCTLMRLPAASGGHTGADSARAVRNPAGPVSAGK